MTHLTITTAIRGSENRFVVHPLRTVLTVSLLLGFGGKLSAESPPSRQIGTVSFEREVLPLLEKRCNRCHHPGELFGGLDLTRLQTIRRGGDELGPAIRPGKPDASPLIQVLTGAAEPAMPENGDSLSLDEIQLLRRWVQEGAHDDTPEFSSDDITFFEREVRPILFRHCFKCHAGEEPESELQLSSRFGLLIGGTRGPAIIRGSPRQSLLIKAVRHEGDLKMPRRGDRLDESQIAALEEWIRRGLPWPSDDRVLTRNRLFTISQADRDHWSFRPLPDLKNDWSIDAELARHHRREQLTPALRADRYRLLRRLTYDLIGYPPTPDEIEAFGNLWQNSSADEAIEAAVDRLLASPHFGWRWGRHWLDYTRNGANGQSNRGPEMDSVRYARWVADSFNRDRPYNWFVHVHLAGDLMPAAVPTDRDYSIDQALAAAVPLNGPRTFQNASSDTFVLMDKLDEGIEFMGRSLMGISLECARCHDHKFDPISQRDYYGLLGFFQSSWFGPVPLSTQSRTEAIGATVRHRQLLHEQARLKGLIRRASTVLNVGGGGVMRAWKESRQAPLAPKEKRVKELELQILKAELEHEQTREQQSAQLIRDMKMTVMEKEETLRDFKPRFFYVVAFKELGYEIHGHKSQIGLIPRAEKLGMDDVAAELTELDQFWIDERNEWNERATFGGYRKSDPKVAQLAAWHDSMLEIKAQLDRHSDSLVIVRCEGGLRRAEDLEPFEQEAKEQNLAFSADLVPAYFGGARLLRRGDVLEPDELIRRGLPEFFGSYRYALEGSGRLDLALWLTEPDSIQEALVARAAVNRAWKNLFGKGLCRTPKELGRLGHVPEMPKLIDGLARRLIDRHWSMKSLLREIVLSDAYQCSAVSVEETLKADPQNTWFARQTVRRLQSEPIMNTMAYLRHGERFVGPAAANEKLLGHKEFFQTFDGPTTDDIIDRRVASITAAQSLFLMNNGTAAQVIAADLLRRTQPSGNPELTGILNSIYRIALQRPPTVEEIEFARGFVSRRREQTGITNHVEENQEFIHLLLCSNEMIYLE